MSKLMLSTLDVAQNLPSPLDRAASPIFLHSSFRTGSTWLWQKLRAVSHTVAYYEIFNHSLETLTAEQARQRDFSSWNSRHPVASPYFLEFLPFLRPEGGVRGFDPVMTYHSFIPQEGPDGALLPAEEAYVGGLISSVGSNRRIPILSCTRSLGRARALQKAFGGRAIFLHRNLFHQWASYCRQAESGNPFFLETIRDTVLGSSHDPFLRNLAEWFDLRKQSVAGANLFQVFMLLHLYLYSIAFDVVDLVVDTTAIATDRQMRREVEVELSNMLACEIDLSDVRQTDEISGVITEAPGQICDTIEQLAKLIPVASLSSNGIDFIERARDHALTDWKKFDAFTRRTRTMLGAKIVQAEARLTEQMVRNVVLEGEVARLTSELANLSRIRPASNDEPAASDHADHDSRDVSSAGEAVAAGGATSSDTQGDLHLMVDGVRCDPQVSGLCARFSMPAGAEIVRLVSPTAIPAELSDMQDRRALGVRVAALMIEDEHGSSREVPVDDLRLGLGFHGVERDGSAMWRWTDGSAHLPASLWQGLKGALYLRVDFAGPPAVR